MKLPTHDHRVALPVPGGFVSAGEARPQVGGGCAGDGSGRGAQTTATTTGRRRPTSLLARGTG